MEIESQHREVERRRGRIFVCASSGKLERVGRLVAAQNTRGPFADVVAVQFAGVSTAPSAWCRYSVPSSAFFHGLPCSVRLRGPVGTKQRRIASHRPVLEAHPPRQCLASQAALAFRLPSCCHWKRYETNFGLSDRWSPCRHAERCSWANMHAQWLSVVTQYQLSKQYEFGRRLPAGLAVRSEAERQM